MKLNNYMVISVILYLLSACTYPVRVDDQPQVGSIIGLSKDVLNNQDFREVLKSMTADDFDHCADKMSNQKDDGSAVLDGLVGNPVNNVVCRRAMNPFNRKTNAWEGEGTPKLRCSRLNKRSNELWVGTIIHEQAHAAGYLHSGNSRKGNQCTVPHVVGDLSVYIVLSGEPPAPLPNDACENLKIAICGLQKDEQQCAAEIHRERDFCSD